MILLDLEGFTKSEVALIVAVRWGRSSHDCEPGPGGAPAEARGLRKYRMSREDGSHRVTLPASGFTPALPIPKTAIGTITGHMAYGWVSPN